MVLDLLARRPKTHTVPTARTAITRMAFITRRAMMIGILLLDPLELLVELSLSARNEPTEAAEAKVLLAGIMESGKVLDPAEN